MANIARISVVNNWLNCFFTSINATLTHEELAAQNATILPENCLRYVAFECDGNILFEVFVNWTNIQILMSYNNEDEVLIESEVSTFEINFSINELFEFLNRKLKQFQLIVTNKLQSTARDANVSVTNLLSGSMHVRYGIPNSNTKLLETTNQSFGFSDQMVIINVNGTIEVLNSSLVKGDYNLPEIEDKTLPFIYHETTHCLAFAILESVFGKLLHFYIGRFSSTLEHRKSYSVFGEGLVVELTRHLIGSGFSPNWSLYNYQIPIMRGVYCYLNNLSLSTFNKSFTSLIQPESSRVFEDFKTKYTQSKKSLANYIDNGQELNSSSEFDVKYNFATGGEIAVVLGLFDNLIATKFIFFACVEDYNKSKSFDGTLSTEEVHNDYSTRHLSQFKSGSYGTQIIDSFKFWFNYVNSTHSDELVQFVTSLPSEYDEFISEVIVKESLGSDLLVTKKFDSEFETLGGIAALF
jgi:hypothetical protein